MKWLRRQLQRFKLHATCNATIDRLRADIKAATAVINHHRKVNATLARANQDLRKELEQRR